MLKMSKNATTLEDVKSIPGVSGYEKLMIAINGKSYEVQSAISVNGLIMLVAGDEVEDK